MIKILLKHYIYELCIQQLFRIITRNFDTNPGINGVKVGDRFAKIVIKFKDTLEIRYFNAEVVEVNDIYFVIEGNACEEISKNESGEYDSYQMEDYRVEIFPDDKTVKYIQ